MPQLSEGAVVCMSGGQDSTTCLAWALSKWENVEAVNFNYGQRHLREVEACRAICTETKVPYVEIDIPALRQIGGGGLTSDDIPIEEVHPLFPNLPGSFVPLRNLILLSTAAAYALKKGYLNVVTGVCQTDYSGYPDCRASFLRCLELTIHQALDLSLERRFAIHAPLMYKTKAESVWMMQELGRLPLLAYSHTCYNNEFPPCGKCPACVLRAKGFEEAGVKDPLLERSV